MRSMPALPTPATMYRAFERHDPAFEGVFWLGVRTTGIFCRPTCRARPPHRKNIEFFGAPADALHAGYRPCKKCRPLDHGRKPPPVVAELMAAIERDPSRRYRDAELVALGIDPSTARRQFRRYCGMTFQSYHRARRMGIALADIRKGKTVLDSQLDQGFESGSGFRAAFARIVGAAPSQAQSLAVLHAKWLETPLGSMLALADDRGLHLLEFVDRRGLERELVVLQRRLKARVLPGEHRFLAQIAAELAAYFSGAQLVFATPVVLTGSTFQTAVWNALLTIPPGATRSYGDIAAAIGNAAAVRAVGRANGDNRLALIVPCHRVVGADGTLTGYGGGLWRKQKLLDHERASAGR
jgi:AraC family transcriptional regulator of adaptative response/methylated-DNA-[protein]-cysteine methyltransferase